MLIFVGKLANSVVSDQTAPQEQSDQGLHCFLRLFCPNIQGRYHSNLFLFWRILDVC